MNNNTVFNKCNSCNKYIGGGPSIHQEDYCVCEVAAGVERNRLRDEKKIKIHCSRVLTCFHEKTVGSKVSEKARPRFLDMVAQSVAGHDGTNDRVQGQSYIVLNPEACEYVEAGVGKHQANEDAYVVRNWRGKVRAFLSREHAIATEAVHVIVYTKEAYLADPEVTEAEDSVITASRATHVLVAVLGIAGPKAPLDPERFVSNLAGGNNEALAWTADEIREKAKESNEYHSEFCVVAD